VPLVQFSIARGIQTLRYVLLEVPPDDTSDARLKDPHVVAVLTYAAAERVIREALTSSDDPKQAIRLRFYANARRVAGGAGSRERQRRTCAQLEIRRELELSLSAGHCDVHNSGGEGRSRSGAHPIAGASARDGREALE
jgi:hypothetical protein